MRLTHNSRVKGAVEDNSADLLRYFLRRVENPEDAADLVGETFVVLWRRSADLPSAPVEARMWLFGVARHVLLSHVRSTSKVARLVSLLRDLPRQDRYESPSESIDLERALQALAEPKRELVLLIHGDGLSIAEAAGVLDINPSTARSRYSSALGELRSLLDDASSQTDGPLPGDAPRRADVSQGAK